jgi:hypothetical protein
VAKLCQGCQLPIADGALCQGIVRPTNGRCIEFWLCVPCFRAELREQHLRMAHEDPSLEVVIAAMWARVSGWTALRGTIRSTGSPRPRPRLIPDDPITPVVTVATNPVLVTPRSTGTPRPGIPRSGTPRVSGHDTSPRS